MIICSMCFKEQERCIVVNSIDHGNVWVCGFCVNLEIGELNKENKKLQAEIEALKNIVSAQYNVLNKYLNNNEAMEKVVKAARKLLNECPDIDRECDGQQIDLEQALKELEGE